MVNTEYIALAKNLSKELNNIQKAYESDRDLANALNKVNAVSKRINNAASKAQENNVLKAYKLANINANGKVKYPITSWNRLKKGKSKNQFAQTTASASSTGTQTPKGNNGNNTNNKTPNASNTPKVNKGTNTNKTPNGINAVTQTNANKTPNASNTPNPSNTPKGTNIAKQVAIVSKPLQTAVQEVKSIKPSVLLGFTGFIVNSFAYGINLI